LLGKHDGICCRKRARDRDGFRCAQPTLRADSNSPKTLRFKRWRITIQKRTMLDESPKPKLDTAPKTKLELEALVLAKLRAAAGCDGAVHVTVVVR
jgi:hypothetical protein